MLNEEVVTMKKTRKILLAMVLVIIVTSSGLFTNTVQAAICSYSPDGLHHYDDHQLTGSGYSLNIGDHQHLVGYEQGNPVYRTCHLTQYFNYCHYKCTYCGSVNDANFHMHSYLHHSVGGSNEPID